MGEFDNNLGFDWDSGNLKKSLIKHGVTQKESEEIFFDECAIVSEDSKHSQKEERRLILGETGTGRYLSVTFTLRNPKIRIISARPMNKKERRLYEKIKNNS